MATGRCPDALPLRPNQRRHGCSRRRSSRQLLISAVCALRFTEITPVEGFTVAASSRPQNVVSRAACTEANTAANTAIKSVMHVPDSAFQVNHLSWWSLLPAPWKPRLEYKWEWNESDSYRDVLDQLSWIQNPQQHQELETCMACFALFCQENFSLDQQSYRARIVSGWSTSAAKCPRWHVDHVPVRWIHSLVGPGCKWIANSDSAIRLDKLNSSQDDNEDILDDGGNNLHAFLKDERTAEIQQAAPGVPMLFAGNRWNEFSLRQRVPPALHKSPEGLRPWESRVLLTMDIQVDY